MARGRLISKSLGSSRKFHAALMAGGKLGEFCQVLFMLIVANTDDYGRMPGDAFTVKNVALPSSRRSEADFDLALDALDRVGLVERYRVDGAIYLQVNNFDSHQPNLHKRPKARFPESPGLSGIFRENSGKPALTQNSETQNPEVNPEPSPLALRAPDSFEQFWDAYPKKKAKTAARQAWEKHRPDGDLVLTILAAIASQRHSHDWQKENGRYIPFPATWLNRGQWTDGTDEPPTALVSDRTQQNLVNREEAMRLIEANTYGRRG